MYIDELVKPISEDEVGNSEGDEDDCAGDEGSDQELPKTEDGFRHEQPGENRAEENEIKSGNEKHSPLDCKASDNGVVGEGEDDDDEDEDDEDSSSGGEDSVVDNTSGDADPAETCTEDGREEKQGSVEKKGRIALFLPLVSEDYLPKSTNVLVFSCSQPVFVADDLSPDNIDGSRKIQVGEKEGPLGHALKVLD
ncbi:hypothetical protein U1Q18_017862, partial [Sarracenia purpurea var. burkii]